MKKLLLIMLAVAVLTALTACSTPSAGKTTVRATEAPTATPGIEVTTAP